MSLKEFAAGTFSAEEYHQFVLLAPDIVEVILDGRQPAYLTLKSLMRPFPVEWTAQKTYLFTDVSTRQLNTSNQSLEEAMLP